MDGERYTALFEAPDGRPILRAYADPLTKSAPWTIGLGHTGPDVQEDSQWTEPQCMVAFHNDYGIATSHAAQIIGAGCWSSLCGPRRAVLTDMAFQMGANGLRNFRFMLDAVRNSHWIEAKIHLLDSNYAKQTANRAIRNANVLETGEWPEDLAQGASTS